MSGAAQWVESYFAPPGPALTNATTGTQNDVPTTENRFQRNRIRFTGAAPTVTGLAEGKTGRRMSLYAIGGPLILANENTGSLVGNRIVTGTGADLTISQGAIANLEYDEEAQRWRVAAGGSGGGGTGGGASTEHLAALRWKVGTTDKENTVLLGTSSSGDAGGDVFWWDAASTETDNNGTIVKPTAIGGGSPGRWKRVHDGTHHNVKWFGAVGDGVTNDTPAFQAAIDAIPTITGQGAPFEIKVPRGTYRLAGSALDSTVAIHLVRRVVMRGSGSHRSTEVANMSTKLLVDDGVTAFKAWHGNMSYADSQHAFGAVLEDLGIVAAGHTIAGAYGLHMCTAIQVNRCAIYNFSSHGIYIDGTFGFPDNWQLTWTRCSENGGDGVFVEGTDANNGLALGLDCQWNKGYGIRDGSFLGCTWIACHSAENLLGGYSDNSEVAGPAVSVFLACYGEGDQPPTAFERRNTVALASTDGAGFTPSSQHTGGYAKDVRPQFVVSKDALPLTSAGTAPPPCRLTGKLANGESLNLRVEITTAGQPGGHDKWGVATGTTAEYRWSNDGGATWNGPFATTETWNLYASGLCQIAIGSTGMKFVFVQGDYATDNVWTAGAGQVGGLESFCQLGSQDGTHSPLAWGHTGAETGAPGADAGYSLYWSAAQGLWQFRWASSAYYQSFAFTGNALPRAGHLVQQDGTWFGDATNGYNRITRASAANTVGDSTWLTFTGIGNGYVGWFTAGDIVTNCSNTTPYPRQWRAKNGGGYAANSSGVDPTWSSGLSMVAGDSIVANSTVYRAVVAGTLAAGADPTAGWSTTAGAQFTDGTVTLEVVGPHGPSIFEPVGIQSEVLGTYDASAGSAVLTLVESSYERLKITGAPGAGFDLEMPSAQGANGWRRAIWNTSGQIATIKGSAGDAGIAVPDTKAYDIISDGTNCVRVE